MMKTGILFSFVLLTGISAHAATVICYDNSCKPITNYSPQQISSQLEEMFRKGAKEFLFCEADKQTKKCQNRPISFPARTNLTYINVQVPFVRISQVKRQNMDLKMVLDYQIRANEYYPPCSGSYSSLALGTVWGGDLQLTSSPFNCQMTDMGTTQVAFQFNLDYVDLNLGRFGGTYQVSVRGDVLGNGSGYALLQFNEKRSLEKERPLPTDFVGREGYIGGKVSSDDKSGKLIDWDMDHVKEKWNSFKEIF